MICGTLGVGDLHAEHSLLVVLQALQMYGQVTDDTIVISHFLFDAFGLALYAHFSLAISPFDQSVLLLSWSRCMVEGWISNEL